MRTVLVTALAVAPLLAGCSTPEARSGDLAFAWAEGMQLTYAASGAIPYVPLRDGMRFETQDADMVVLTFSRGGPHANATGATYQTVRVAMAVMRAGESIPIVDYFVADTPRPLLVQAVLYQLIPARLKEAVDDVGEPRFFYDGTDEWCWFVPALRAADEPAVTVARGTLVLERATNEREVASRDGAWRLTVGTHGFCPIAVSRAGDHGFELTLVDARTGQGAPLFKEERAPEPAAWRQFGGTGQFGIPQDGPQKQCRLPHRHAVSLAVERDAYLATFIRTHPTAVIVEAQEWNYTYGARHSLVWDLTFAAPNGETWAVTVTRRTILGEPATTMEEVSRSRGDVDLGQYGFARLDPAAPALTLAAARESFATYLAGATVSILTYGVLPGGQRIVTLDWETRARECGQIELEGCLPDPSPGGLTIDVGTGKLDWFLGPSTRWTG